MGAHRDSLFVCRPKTRPGPPMRQLGANWVPNLHPRPARLGLPGREEHCVAADFDHLGTLEQASLAAAGACG
jgi:hypothetical protein